MTIDRGAIQELVTLGIASLEARRIDMDGRPYAVMPEGWVLHDLETQLPTPVRANGTTSLHETDSFIAWINERKGDASRVYAVANPNSGVRYVAVLNDTTQEQAPHWGDWRGIFTPLASPEWQTWLGMNGKRGAQRDFAEFIESNVDDVFSGSPSEPPGAVLLELASVLQATMKCEFASAVRLSNGTTQLRYAETLTASGGNGQLEMPEQFFLGIPVFIGGPTYKIGARLRYRLHGSALQIGYELVRPHKVVEAAAADITARIREQTALPVYMGACAA
jgi:uncharacterized protein YfdQ (DUF2303 family)